MPASSKVSTCLWFDREAEQAAKLYTSLLPNSRITSVSRYGKDAPMPEGTPMLVTFDLDGSEYVGLNGGPHFKQTEACSIVVRCDTQDEIDRLWEGLLADGGREAECFWLKDRFGLSWQVWPSQLGQWMDSADPLAAARVFGVVMSSVKPDIAALEAAYRG